MKAALSLLALLGFVALLFFAGNEEEKERSRSTVEKEVSSPKKAKNKTEASKQKPKQKGKSTRKSKNKKKGKNKSGKTILFWSNRLLVKPERSAGYDRDDFPHWSDLDGNGCDTREDVLRQENLRQRGNLCYDDRGLWYSAYDGEKTRDSSSFDVDHMVPLAEAYASGAWKWNENKRERYANDRYRPSLIAVSASSNREKSDQDPAEWLPERRQYLCTYLASWVSVKYRWRLSVDKREKQAIRRLARGCPKKRLSLKRKGA